MRNKNHPKLWELPKTLVGGHSSAVVLGCAFGIFRVYRRHGDAPKYPDLMFTNRRSGWTVEHKSGSHFTYYVDPEGVKRITVFSMRFWDPKTHRMTRRNWIESIKVD